MKIFYLLIVSTYIINIDSYESFKLLHNDNEMNILNEMMHEKLTESIHNRVKRAARDDTTNIYDGSGGQTHEVSTYITPTSMTYTIQLTNITIEQTSLPITTNTISTATATSALETIYIITSAQQTPTITATMITLTSMATNNTMTSATVGTVTGTEQTSVHVLTTTTSMITVACNTSTEIRLPNGTCISKSDGQIYAVQILRSNSTNSTVAAIALSLYISLVADPDISSNSNNTLTFDEIDTFVSNINSVNLIINTNDSFIMVQQPQISANVSVSGAAFYRGVGGQVASSLNIDNVINSSVSIMAIVSNASLVGATSISMLIIDKPTAYENIDNSSNKKLASSVIVAAVQRNGSSSGSMNISLYFQVLNEYAPNVPAKYLCSFYANNTATWNESGCTAPQYNTQFNRYECSCNHLTTFALVWSPVIACNTTTEVELSNGTCISKENAQINSFNILTGNSTDPIVVGNALSLYISSVTNANISSNSNITLTVEQIDRIVKNINSVNLTINTNDSFIMAQQINQSENVFVLGASFDRGIGGQIISSVNRDNVTSSYVSTAAIVSIGSLVGITSLNMLIINKPTTYENVDNSSNKKLASSVIVAAVRQNRSLVTPVNISLFFQVLNDYKPNVSARYLCSFYDTNTSKWNESGCTEPTYNTQFNRYECSCNHLTSFALIWLPQSLPTNGTRTLDAQDIASLVFQSISILSFLAIIIHAIVIRTRDSLMKFQPYNLLPLISGASTTILFIFFIALGMTTFTQTPNQGQAQCFLSSSVLMFFVYFFLIFMFCVKTSVGYFNYLRFVYLFPDPSFRRLLTMLTISFSISIASVVIAIGLNSSSYFKITQLYSFKLCWFTRDVIHYFVTIPVCLFLGINLITFIFVGKRIISHARNATTRHASYERMRQCVIVLLASCVTQGLGWILGPLITVADPTTALVSGWLFVIFNGLEGVWSILIYMIVQDQHMDEQKRVTAVKDMKKSKNTKSDRYKKLTIEDNENESTVVTNETEVQHQNTKNDASLRFNDLRLVRNTTRRDRDDVNRTSNI